MGQELTKAQPLKMQPYTGDLIVTLLDCLWSSEDHVMIFEDHVIISDH